MKNLLCILFALYIPVKTFNVFNNDGWVPVIPYNYDKFQEKKDTRSPPINEPSHFEEILADDVIKVVLPDNISIEETLTPRVNYEQEAYQQEMEHINDKITYPNRNSSEDEHSIENIGAIKRMSNKNTRKGKYMSAKANINEVIKNFDVKPNIYIDNTRDEKVIDKKDSINKLYEVTESLPNTVDLIEESNDEKAVAYFSEPPKPNKTDLTNNFLNILSKYNIKVNDKLQNYALSRKVKEHNRLPSRLMYYPNNLRIPYGYNSLNHLPVDPVLAVILSNYGYYLPGLYGINRNYRNLYGYLASNNIHNNKPFGLYKIYSDTDSSH